MKASPTTAHETYPDTHHDAYSKTIFGFWIYLMGDLIFFGALFATYTVLNESTFGGPTARELFNLPYTLIQSLVLLFASFMAGLGGTAAHRKEKGRTLLFFSSTFVLGSLFLGMEINEFARLIAAGNRWDQSAFLSSYFTVVATLGVHVIFGLLWVPILLIPVLLEKSLSHVSIRRLTCLKMFWQFVNIIWIFIFSLVYLLGVG